MNYSSILFPGEGCEYIGMGKLLYDNFKTAKEVYNFADSKLGYHLSEIIFYGEQKSLLPPQIQQPAILTVSTALYHCMKENIDLSVDCMMGYGIGEFSALVCAGILKFEEALDLAVKRGDAIEQLSNKDADEVTTTSTMGKNQELGSIQNFKNEINKVKVSKSKSIKVISAATGKEYSNKENVVSGLAKGLTSHYNFAELLNLVSSDVHNCLIDIGPSRCWYKIVKDASNNARIATMDANGDPFYCIDILENKKLFNMKYLIGRMIVASISFENHCLDDSRYNTGVCIPYARMNEIYDSIELQTSEAAKQELLKEARKCLVKIMQTKGLEQEEIQWRLKKLEDETLIPLYT